MRKGQRFTPAKLAKWGNIGRGLGTGPDYQPWHQVTRDDPSSRGRSHLLTWRFGRLHHLLSDLELVVFAFASMLPGVVDLREQFPLCHGEHLPELATYDAGVSGEACGTRQIADELGYLHPLARREKDVSLWVMTTDILLTLKNQKGTTELLAVSAKYGEELDAKRTRQLLHIEREYWHRQGVTWLLLTPDLYTKSVSTAIRIGMPFTLGQPDAAPDLIRDCSALASHLDGRTWRESLDLISCRFALDTQSAQCVLWQAIWSGQLPLDLGRMVRMTEPLKLISVANFWQQNPVASRRTSWSH
ncbi:hypothetical protein J2W25_000878 [Variovorax boronicumulans]|uniref:TnsA endonuclease N-terminal domain-containing protein n=1 Tax=Variovorax boronicumulans TaxID=436515 RepID=A0AAW8DQV2_9BURK|nr:TnsA endonuclease N-terminal domain-containing protein [Variovorax boronicumulans]MDP9877260.1 hypothetical protein [Variovorax boronicumulans]MDP9921863.1 hypothetical protein [Variovorax boronicumulans]